MTLTDTLEILRQAVLVTLMIGAPLLLISLSVGLCVSLFQALTQIQEMTLAFIPKIIAVFLSLLLFLPHMITTLQDFTLELYNRIAGGTIPGIG